MKKNLTTVFIAASMILVLSACNKEPVQTTPPAPSEDSSIEVVSIDPAVSDDNVSVSESVNDPEPVEEAETTDNDADTAASKDHINKADAQPIVWLGDSLTQGSMGDDNDNLPNAPYEKLKKLAAPVPVEGYGLYGYNSHDIFWVYVDSDHFNQDVDPNKTYVLWVGSNDWVTPDGANSNTQPVIDEIDTFLTKFGEVKSYIIIGTTSRISLGDLYKPINEDLKAHYGEHYMDVIDIINKYGYNGDNTHLTQESYDAVAEAVYEKLIELGYI